MSARCSSAIVFTLLAIVGTVHVLRSRSRSRSRSRRRRVGLKQPLSAAAVSNATRRWMGRGGQRAGLASASVARCSPRNIAANTRWWSG